MPTNNEDHYPIPRRWPFGWLPATCECGEKRFDACYEALRRVVSIPSGYWVETESSRGPAIPPAMAFAAKPDLRPEDVMIFKEAPTFPEGPEAGS